MAFEAKNNYVFLTLDDKEDEVTDFGLVIPTSLGPPPARGKVVAAGPGKHHGSGKFIPNPLSVGDIVHFDKVSAHGLKIEGTEYVWIDADHVECILEEE